MNQSNRFIFQSVGFKTERSVQVFFFPRVRFGRAEGEYGWNRPSGKLLSQIKISASPPSPYQRTLDTIFGGLLRAFCYSCHSLAKTTKAPSKENPPATGDGDNADLRDSVHFHFTRALTPSESAQILYTKHTHTHTQMDGEVGVYCLRCRSLAARVWSWTCWNKCTNGV